MRRCWAAAGLLLVETAWAFVSSPAPAPLLRPRALVVRGASARAVLVCLCGREASARVHADA